MKKNNFSFLILIKTISFSLFFFIFCHNGQTAVPYFSSFLQNLDQFTSFGDVSLTTTGAKLSLENSDFSALSPNFAPIPLHEAYAYQLQFSLENFQLGDQFEFRYLFFTNGDYHAFRCQVASEQNFYCYLLAQTQTSQEILLPSAHYSSKLFANHRRYTLKIYQNATKFQVELWSTDNPNLGKVNTWQHYFYRYYNQENFFPPAIVLAKNLYSANVTQKTAALILHQFQTTPADFLLQLNLWPSYQTDVNWREQILGTTAQTDSPQTIGEIGCALTSATMIFNYYHYSFLPDGSPLDPAGLNHWLTQQPDGYFNHNLLNWQALVRLSTQLHQQYWREQSQLFPKFEYRYVKNEVEDFYWQTNYLYSSLELSQPLIAEVPGHFIVTNGLTMDNQIQVIDPYYPQVKTYNDLDQYRRAQIYNFRHFIPSYTDQSYLIVNVLGKNSFSFANSLDVKYYAVPLYEPTANGENSLIGYQYLIPQPPTGQYKIILSPPNNQNNQFQIFAYNHQGQVEFYPSSSTFIAQSGEVIAINFDKNLEENFAQFTDTFHHHDSWFVFDKQVVWPNQFIRLQFDYLNNKSFFHLADFYRLYYLEKNLISYKLSEQLLNFWQNQL